MTSNPYLDFSHINSAGNLTERFVNKICWEYSYGIACQILFYAILIPWELDIVIKVKTVPVFK